MEKRYEDYRDYYQYAMHLTLLGLSIRKLSSLEYMQFVVKWRSHLPDFLFSYDEESVHLIDDLFIYTFFDANDWPNFVHLKFLHTPLFLTEFTSWISVFKNFHEDTYMKKLFPHEENAPSWVEDKIFGHPDFLVLVAQSEHFLPLLEKELWSRFIRPLPPIRLFGRCWDDIRKIDYQWLEEECQRQLALKKDV